MQTSSMPISVAGPSHIRRFANAIQTGQIAATRRPILWNHLASASALHPYFTRAPFSAGPVPALFFVPDFRIGNRSLIDDRPEKNYLGVSHDLISPENDRAIYDRTMTRVLEIRDKNPECRFVFWCLAGREYANRESGKFQKAGVYSHPTWNLSEVERQVGSQVVSLQGIFTHRIGRLLHIDSSQHPSRIGLEAFRMLVDRPELTFGKVLDEVSDTGACPELVLPPGTLITGDSFWIRALQLYLARGLVTLSEGVEVCAPGDIDRKSPAEFPRVRYVTGILSEASAGLAYEQLGTQISHVRATLDRLHNAGHNIRLFNWEPRARRWIDRAFAEGLTPATSVRAIDARLNGDRPYAVSESATAAPYIHRRDVEVSHRDGVMPTMDGIIAVIRVFGGNFRLTPL